MMSWLDEIGQHPIFSSTSRVASPLEGRCQRVALVRGNELLVAQGRELRIANLLDAKSRQHDQLPATYKSIICPALDFEIRSLAVNSTSKLLAVTGDHKAVVVVLPRKGWHLIVGQSLELNAVQVDSRHLNAEAPPIVQARWHHWSAHGATLLIMTTDGYLREYDLAIDADEPQETLDFRASYFTGSESIFDVDQDDDAACSFCLGYGVGWSALSIYGLLKDGSIYTIIPYAPKKSAIPISDLQSIVADAAENAEKLSNKPIDRSSEAQIREKRADSLLAYCKSLLREAEDIENDNLQGLVQRAQFAHRLKGPHLLRPAPRQLPGARDSSACDILALRNPANAPGNIILTAHNDGRVNIYCDFDSAAAPLDQVPGQLPGMLTLETIDLGLNATYGLAEMTLLQDPAENAIVHVHHRLGVHTIDLSALLAGPADEASASQHNSLVLWQMCTAANIDQAHPVTGSAIVSDTLLGQAIIVQVESGRGAALELTPSVVSEPEIRAQSTPEKQISAQNGYVAVLREPIFAPTNVSLSSRPAVTAAPGTVTTTSLQEMGRVIESLRRDMQSIVAACNVAQDRLRRQLTELPRQTAKLHDFQQRTVRMNPLNGDTRLHKALEVQQKLTQRSDRLLQQLARSQQPEVSSAERAWFSELARMRGEVERVFSRRITKLNESVEALKPRVAAYAAEADSEGRLGVRQVKAVEAQLSIESQLIDEAKFKLENLHVGLGKLALAR